MVKRIGSARRKTRKRISKNIRERGKISISRYVKTFKKGERVLIKIEPSVHKGMPFRRYHGVSGTIIAKKGRCYELAVTDGSKRKIIIAHPCHLRRLTKAQQV